MHRNTWSGCERGDLRPSVHWLCANLRWESKGWSDSFGASRCGAYTNVFLEFWPWKANPLTRVCSNCILNTRLQNTLKDTPSVSHATRSLIDALPPRSALVGIPMRRNQRKCDASPARKETCARYCTPNS